MTHKYLTKQEVFDKVSTHLLTQMKKSIDEYDMCLYKSHDGLKCAIGCLIADEDYKPEMECGYSAERLINSFYGTSIDILTAVNSMMLDDLQRIHDKGEPETWKTRLKNLASDYHLDNSVLNKFPE